MQGGGFRFGGMLDKLAKTYGSGKNMLLNARRNSVLQGGSVVQDEELVDLMAQVSKMATKRGNLLDFYRVEDELGRGAFARVFRGIQRNSGKEVAIKIVSLRSIAEKAVQEHQERKARYKKQGKELPKEDQLSAAEIECRAKKKVLDIMKSEIAVMQKIARIPARKTRNIVRLIDVVVSENQVCVVMDLLTGGELFDRIISRRRYTEKDAAFHVRRVMRALRVLHANDIIHRDLKPENLVFADPGENSHIKLADFGLAKIQGQPDIHAHSIVGSPGYIAPEVLSRKEYTPACDVWAMGVILYILFVGGNPFQGKNDRETFRKIKSGKYGYPRSVKVSVLAKDLISKCLVLDPKKRIGVVGFLNHPWLVQKANTADAYIGLERLKTFNVQTKLKAFGMGLVWGSKLGLRKELYDLLEGTSKRGGLTGEELTVIRTALFKFRGPKEKAALGAPKRGVPKANSTISKTQFVYAMRDLGYNDLPLEEIYALFDSGKNNKADITEIVVGLSTAAKEWDGKSQMRFCFETYDREGTGKLSLNDIAKVVKVAASEMNGNLFKFWRHESSDEHNKVTIKQIEDTLEQSKSTANATAPQDTEEEEEEEEEEEDSNGIAEEDKVDVEIKQQTMEGEKKRASTSAFVNSISSLLGSFSEKRASQMRQAEEKPDDDE